MGVGSAGTAMTTRIAIWNKLATEWNIKDKLNVIAKEVTLDELSSTYIDMILQGRTMGRIVINLRD